MLNLNNNNLYNIADIKTKNIVNTYIEEWKDKGLLTGYFGMLANNIYKKNRVKNSVILELLIYGTYIEEQNKLKEKEQQIMYDDVNYYYQEGQKEVNNTLKKKKPISIIDMALFLYLLEQPNYTGLNYEKSIQATIQYNTQQLYKQILINIQQQKELEIENDEFQNILNRQENTKLCINNDKISGFMDTQIIGLNNQAKVEGIKELDNNINAKVKFVAVIDSKETDMCNSLNGQEFYINKENIFDRYYGETQKELRMQKIKCKGLVLGLNLPPITHHFHYCRSYIIYLTHNINSEFNIKRKIARSLKKNMLKYNTKGVSKIALLENFIKANKVLNDFPILKNKIINVQIRENKDYLMAIKPKGNGYKLYINKDMFSTKKKVKNEYNNLLKAGETPKGTSYKDILNHELGHATIFEIIKNKYNNNLRNMEFDWENNISAKEIVNEALNNIKITDYDKRYKAVFNLSKYSLENASETVAEAFADYYANGKKSKKISKEIIKIMRGRL